MIERDPTVSTVARLLGGLEGGDGPAIDEPILYDELRELAGRQRSRCCGNHTLNTTEETATTLAISPRTLARGRHIPSLSSHPEL